MGNAISTVVEGVLGLLGIVRHFEAPEESGQQIVQNPVMLELEQHAEEDQRLREEAERQRSQAEEERRLAEEAREWAQQEQQRAEEEKGRAEHERWEAEEGRRRAEEARQQLEAERQRAEEGQRRAEQEKREAEEYWQRIDDERQRVEADRRHAEEQRQRAEHAHRETEEKRRRAVEERERAELERQRAEDEKGRADEDKQRAEEQRHRAEEARLNAEQEVLRANAERQRAEEEKQRAELDKQQADEERKKAEEERQKAEKDKQRARAAQEEAEIASTAAAQAAEEARAAQEEAEKRLKAGIRPVVWPTAEEIRDHKERRQYREGKLHFAIAGIAGSGKSSLINALRGVTNRHHDAARVGITETTKVIARYEDPNTERPFVWYDVPGAGTLTIPDWKYFNDFGLYIFDAIIVLFDNRFTETDVALLRNAALFQIPSYIVRSKSMFHIDNLLTDLGFGVDEDKASRLATARQIYIKETRDSVSHNLSEANLPQQRVYLIAAKENLYEVVKGRSPAGIIDEVELLTDILEEARVRRLKAKPAQPRVQPPAHSGFFLFK